MRKSNKDKHSEAMRNEITKTLKSSSNEFGNTVTICPTYNVSYYLANAFVYFASRKRREDSIRAFERSISYLENLSDNASSGRLQVWDKADVCVVGYEFKGLADLIKHEHEPEDIGTALQCLCTLKTIIKHGHYTTTPDTNE
jgi:hypothetical protein